MEIITGIGFRNVVTSGSQKAWEIDAVDGLGNLGAWCVKLYSPVNHNHATINDIICSCLAKELDINTPDFGMLQMNSDFKLMLPEDQLVRFNKLEHQYLFCTKWLTPSSIIELPVGLITLKHYDLESVYAFDFLIQNKDRRQNKPNLLISKGDCFVIDHEMTFSNAGKSFSQHKIQKPANHLLKEYLKNNPKTSFDTFIETIKHFKPNNLSRILEDINNLGYDPDYADIVITYIEEVKDNLPQFITELKASLI